MDNSLKKLFRFGEKGMMLEWIVAIGREEALEFYKDEIGEDVLLANYEDYYSYLEYCDFLDMWINEEEQHKFFTLKTDDGEIETITVREHLEKVDYVPSYFACME